MKVSQKKALLGGIGVFTIISLFFGLRPVGTQETGKPSTNVRNRDDEYLVVSLFGSKSLESTDEERRKKNRKFDRWNWIREHAGSDETSVVMSSDWQVNLPPLPVSRSTAILKGVVRKGEAFLSNDRTGIYSEFEIRITDSIKGVRKRRTAPQIITITRAGGRTLYPSGKVVNYAVSGQSMREIGKTYWFFLKYDEVNGQYGLITAYAKLPTVARSAPLMAAVKAV